MNERRDGRPSRTDRRRASGSRRRGALLVRAAGATAAAALLVGAVACARPPERKSLEVLVPVLPSTLDPFADTRLVARSLFTAIYEPLVEETASGLRPAIADSWTNPAPETWVFHIGEGERFHDGTPVRSRDVVKAALASRASHGSLASLGDLKTIEVRDDRTVRFRTLSSAEDFLLAVSALFIPRNAGDSWMGTGPYRVVAATPDRVVLRRHDRPRHPSPLLEEVVFRRVTSSAAGIRLLRRDRPSAALDPTPAMVDEVRTNPRYRVLTTDSGGLAYVAVGFSAGAGPLGDVRVRRALRLAIDYPALTAAGAVNGGTPAGQLVPPGSFGYDPKRTAPRRDLAEARHLLAAAGFPSGFDSDLDVNPNGRRAGEALAAQAAEAGIRLHVQVRTPDDFAARIDGHSPLYIYSWFVGRDAGQALRNAFHTPDPARGLGSLNRTGYSSAAVDDAFVSLASASRQEERLRRLHEIADLLDADLPFIPLFSTRDARILPAWLDLPSRPGGLFVIAEACLVVPPR